VATPGYDAKLRIYYAPVGKLALPAIPDAPTQQDCVKAAEVIGEVFADFPFVSEADRANYYALLLTPLVRHLVDNVPLALLDSPQKGTGKTLLADALGLVHEGMPPTKWTVPYSQETWEKILTTILLSGSAISIFDNLEGVLHAPVLAKLLTSAEHSDRAMRTHAEMRIPNATMFLVTGNNIRVAGDLDRRCYRIRIDARMPHPWERKRFRIPGLKAYVRKQRGELLAALLTMARGWFAAGKPVGKGVIELGGGFEDWSRKVGRMLAYAGVEGFLGNQQKLYQELNPGENSWERFLQEARGHFPRGFTVRMLVECLDAANFDATALPEDEGFGGNRGNWDAKKIGGALLRNRERRFGVQNLYLKSKSRAGQAALWIVKADEPESGKS
jgi:hypothetical protein